MIDDWIAVEALPSLDEDEVQVWRIELPETETPADRFACLLSAEEQARALRLRAGQVRVQFLVARACLRTLLGNALQIDPKLVQVTQTSYGKPETEGVYFNVAHSRATILIALCRHHRVGVDVEYFSRDIDELEIAKNSFTNAEYRSLSSIGDAEELRRAFFRCWTRKEAVIKADGRGMSLPLDSFEVPVGEIAAMTRVSDPESATAWAEEFYLTDLNCGIELAASIAAGAATALLRGFVFPLHRVLASS